MAEAAGMAPKLRHEALTEQILGAAIEVHKSLGPGLLESAYEECMCHELNLRGIRFERQVSVPVTYKGVNLDCGYKLDLLIENTVILELKCVERITSIHEAQTAHVHEASEQASRIYHQLQCSGIASWYSPEGFMTCLSPCLRASVVNTSLTVPDVE